MPSYYLSLNRNDSKLIGLYISWWKRLMFGYSKWFFFLGEEPVILWELLDSEKEYVFSIILPFLAIVLLNYFYTMEYFFVFL